MVESQLRTSDVDLNTILKNLLEHSTPQTKDQALLNELTTKQIANSTYIENTLPRNSSDVNIIVPQSLYKSKINQVWRYPPYMSVDFLIKKSDKDVRMSIDGGFGAARFFVYGENRNFGRATFARYISNPDIKNPEDFSKILFEGKNYDIKDQRAFVPKSVSPVFYEFNSEVTLKEILNIQFSKNFSIPENIITIKKFDETNEKQISALSSAGIIEKNNLDKSSLNKKIEAEKTRVAFVDLVSGQISFSLVIKVNEEPGFRNEYYRVSISLINDQEYSAKRPKDLEWRLKSLICPYFSVKINGTEIKIPPQQHAEVLKNSLKSEKDELEEEFLYTYNQTNSVLTVSTKNPQLLICTTFGVFDTVREIPTEGPEIDKLISNDENLFSELYRLTEEQKKQIAKNPILLKILKGTLKAAKEAFKIPKYLYKYQWDAIQNRIQLLLENKGGTTTVIKAPTGAGKTIVFMVNAAIYSLSTGKRSVMIFPTRILNEDMFKRLTRFIYHLRKNIDDESITGGIFIGSSDPLYKAISSPQSGSKMIQYDQCPSCEEFGSIVAKDNGTRIIGECEKCGHSIDYMYGTQVLSKFSVYSSEITCFLPLITIATPDKLFYEATVRGFEFETLRFFGGMYKKCQCGFCIPISPRDSLNSSVVCKICNSKIDISRPDSSPIGYYVFDEVHSLYGLTGTLISIFLETLKLMQNKIIGHNYVREGYINIPTFETGTATIANEIELLKAITRTPEDKITSFPNNSEYSNYFQLNEDEVRYRTLVLLPVAKAARTTTSNTLLSTYIDFHINNYIKSILKNMNDEDSKSAYDFILGYVYRKSDGYTLKRTINDLSKQILGKGLKVEFLSGDSSSATIARLFEMALEGEIQVLLANLVISLGIDIRNLNNMIMMGIPKNMTEYIQTAGRTGRGKMPGHITIHLLPSNPRDTFLYKNFHLVMSDVKGYYDRKPIQSTNSYAAQIIFPNILKAILAAQSYHIYCLTAPSISYYFGGDPKRRTYLELDIMRVLTESSTPQGIKQEIYKIIRSELNNYLNKLTKLRGQGHYLSTWLEDEGLILYSLRDQTERDIGVVVSDTRLLSLIEEQQKKPWIGRFVKFEEEAIEKEYPDVES